MGNTNGDTGYTDGTGIGIGTIVRIHIMYYINFYNILCFDL